MSFVFTLKSCWHRG